MKRVYFVRLKVLIADSNLVGCTSNIMLQMVEVFKIVKRVEFRFQLNSSKNAIFNVNLHLFQF